MWVCLWTTLLVGIAKVSFHGTYFYIISFRCSIGMPYSGLNTGLIAECSMMHIRSLIFIDKPLTYCCLEYLIYAPLSINPIMSSKFIFNILEHGFFVLLYICSKSSFRYNEPWIWILIYCCELVSVKGS